MGFDKVENAVLAEAEAEAEAIVNSAKQEGDEALARFREEAEKKLEDEVRAAETAALRETARTLGIARQEGRMAVLTAKNDVLEKIFTGAAEKLRSLSVKEYQSMAEGLLKSLPSDIGGTLRVHPDDEAAFSSDMINSVNSGREEAARFTGVEKDQKIGRGFIVEGHNFTADFTIDSLLAKVREEVIGELAKELFES